MDTELCQQPATRAGGAGTRRLIVPGLAALPIGAALAAFFDNDNAGEARHRQRKRKRGDKNKHKGKGKGRDKGPGASQDQCAATLSEAGCQVAEGVWHCAGADLSSAALTGCSLKGAHLAGANLTDADVQGADLEGAHLAGANLTGALLGAANVRGAHLAASNLSGTHWAFTTCPDGTDSDNNDAGNCCGHLNGAVPAAGC